MDAASTSSAKRPGDRRRYAGVFLIALATLMLEVLLTRLTSVVAWYHLAFFVISLAMLGMTAGAVHVFVRPERYADADVGKRIAGSALGFAIAIPIAITTALALPLEPVTNLMTFAALLVIGSVLAVPFVLGGIALTLALTRSGLPTGTVYGVDLIGAALGCASVVPVLRVIDAPSAAVLAAAIAALAAVCFASAERLPVRRPWLTAIGLLFLVFLNTRTDPGFIRPAWVKGLREDPAAFAFLRWNTYSRITVRHTLELPPVFWARGRNAPTTIDVPLKQRYIEIDGAAGTVMVENGNDLKSHNYLSWDVTASAHVLRPTGPAAVIGVGGGRDVLEAARVGHSQVVGVEINDLIVSLHKGVMRDFSRITEIPNVKLVTDEARSYMARDKDHYTVITMSLIDTWASTGAGAYSLSENGLYTVEAWKTFVNRLTPNGIFTVSRWYVVDSPGETARMLALAMETLYSLGVEDPRKNIILLQADKVATLLLSRSAYSDSDLDLAQRMATHKGFNMMLTPRRAPVHPLLKKLMAQKTRAAMHAFAASQPLDLTPPTDQRPFFFNMLKPLGWFAPNTDAKAVDMAFLGNLAATHTLLYATLISLLLSIATLIVPMKRRVGDLASLPRGDVLAALLYFALIGLGFMLVEIGILSRLSVFLGHPTLALSVLLSGIILFTGIGSMLSGRIDVTRGRWATIYPLLTAAGVLCTAFAMEPVMARLVSSQAPTRIAASLALLVLPALGMGLCFPLGLRLTEAMERARSGEAPRLGPWLWGINGAFGVCASGLALGCSMVFGIRTTLFAGMLCYVLLPLATRRLVKSAS